MSKLIIPVEFHFPAKVTTRSGGVMTKIKEKFEKLDLMEKAKNSMFGHFFKAAPIQFSGVIIHQLLLRKVVSKYQNELHFNIGGRNLRFGIVEFALITGLNFGPELDLHKFKEITKSRRLVELYMNDKEDVKLGDLESAFVKCNEKDDAWKLGLCYLVAGLLMSTEANGFVYKGLLSIVDDEDEFFKYPWGCHTYYKTLSGVNKNMVTYKEKYFANIKRKKKREAKYTVYGYHLALIYWAFEAIPTLATQYAEYSVPKFPRMLSWTSNTIPMAQVLSQLFNQKNQTLFSVLNPRSDEKDFVSQICHSANNSSLAIGTETTKVNEMDIDKEVNEDRTKGGDTGVPSHEHFSTFQFEKLCSDVVEIKDKQLVLEKKMDTIIQLLKIKNKSGQDSNSEGTSSDLFRVNYETPLATAENTLLALAENTPLVPSENTPLAPAENTPLAPYAEKIVEPCDVAHVKFKRRKFPSEKFDPTI